jgi:drug/metabolite transporter (DMT)-like permease
VSIDDLTDIALWTVVCGVLGARLYYVFTKFSDYKADSFIETVKNIFSFRDGGLAIYGGIICGCLLCIASTLQTYGMADRTLQAWGMQGTTAGKSGFITAMYMIIVPFLGLLFKKRPSWIAIERTS